MAVRITDAVAREQPDPALDDRDRAMLAFARKLTKAPGAVTEADAVALRAVGFDDRELFDITAIISFFNYVNRVALGLGVPLSANWEQIAAMMIEDAAPRSNPSP
jgi:uncharacterized peroxidase-related enzyme